MNTLNHVFERIVLKRRTDGLYRSSPAGIAAHEEHFWLLEAIRTRDAVDAVATIRAHVRAGKNNVVADLKQRRELRELQTAIK